VGGGAGYTMPSESYYGKGLNFGGTFGIGVTEHLAVELRVPFFQSDMIGAANRLSSGRLSRYSLVLSVQGRYIVKDKFVPYLAAGGDYHLHTLRLNDEITQYWSDRGFSIQESVNHAFGFHFGAGLDVFLKRNIAINLDVRYHLSKMKGKRTMTNQVSQEPIKGTINNLKLNSLQAGISVKLFLHPRSRKI
jgi:opacity protein-like surface antigen